MSNYPKSVHLTHIFRKLRQVSEIKTIFLRQVSGIKYSKNILGETDQIDQVQSALLTVEVGTQRLVSTTPTAKQGRIISQNESEHHQEALSGIDSNHNSATVGGIPESGTASEI